MKQMRGKEVIKSIKRENKTKMKGKNRKINGKKRWAEMIKAKKWTGIVRTGFAAFIFSLIAVTGIHHGYARFTAQTEVKVNSISLVSGEQDQEGALLIVEPEWDAIREADAGYAMDMQPGEKIVKDPRVESTLDYPCWVFVVISIPEAWAILEKADNIYEYVTFAGDATDYTYEFELVVPEINKEDWQIYKRVYEKHFITYVYGYKIPLKAHETTSPVFESFTVPMFKQLEGGESYILIRAEAVQAEGCRTLDDAAKKLGITSDIQWTTIQP